MNELVTSEAAVGTGGCPDPVPAVPRQQTSDHLSETAKIRRRCVYWLDSECRGGPEHRCIPVVRENSRL